MTRRTTKRTTPKPEHHAPEPEPTEAPADVDTQPMTPVSGNQSARAGKVRGPDD
jgi:hypothetical protein